MPTEIKITNDKIIFDDGSLPCTLKNAHRFAAAEFKMFTVTEKIFEPKADEFDKVVAYLRSRCRKSNS